MNLFFIDKKLYRNDIIDLMNDIVVINVIDFNMLQNIAAYKVTFKPVAGETSSVIKNIITLENGISEGLISYFVKSKSDELSIKLNENSL